MALALASKRDVEGNVCMYVCMYVLYVTILYAMKYKCSTIYNIPIVCMVRRS